MPVQQVEPKPVPSVTSFQGTEEFWIIYSLSTPTDGVRYIGVTSQSPKKRMEAHLRRARNEDSHKDRWLRKLLSCGVTPTLTILERGTGDGWQEAEQRWIKTYRDIGVDLTNSTAGGEGCRGFRHSESSRVAMSASHAGKKISNEHRAAISRALKGRPISQSHREAMRGHRHTPETLKRMSDAQRGHSVTDKTRAKISASKKGKPVSAAGRIGKPLSEKHRAAIAKALKSAWSEGRRTRG